MCDHAELGFACFVYDLKVVGLDPRTAIVLVRFSCTTEVVWVHRDSSIVSGESVAGMFY